MPPRVRRQIAFTFVDHMDQVLNVALKREVRTERADVQPVRARQPARPRDGRGGSADVRPRGDPLHVGDRRRRAAAGGGQRSVWQSRCRARSRRRIWQLLKGWPWPTAWPCSAATSRPPGTCCRSAAQARRPAIASSTRQRTDRQLRARADEHRGCARQGDTARVAAGANVPPTRAGRSAWAAAHRRIEIP